MLNSATSSVRKNSGSRMENFR